MSPDSGMTGTRGTVSTAGAEHGQLVDESNERDRAARPFFFSAPGATMLAAGVDATVPKTTSAGDRSGLTDRVREFFRGARRFGRNNPVLVGAVPFDDALPAHLVLPSVIHRQGSVQACQPAPGVGMPTRLGCSVRQLPGDQEYQRALSRLLRRLTTNELDRAVLARCVELTMADPIDPSAVVRNLAAQSDADVCAFGVALPPRGADGTKDCAAAPLELTRSLVGANPLLLSKHGTQVTVYPLVDSAMRGQDAERDRRRARELSAAAREKRGYDAVTQAALAALRPLCSTVHVAETPTLTATPSVWHLRREITAQVPDPEVSSLMLATAVHQGHGQCGTPAKQANELVTRSEPFDRGYYTGLVGWCDSAGDGAWAPALQCAEIEDRTVRAYAHADVVAGSDAHAEREASSAALHSWLAALGCDSAGL